MKQTCIITNTKKKRVSQSDVPQASLEEAVELAKTLVDQFAGTGATGINLAKAHGRSPSSSAWRALTGATVAYGITDGGYNANTISLTELGKKIVMPTSEGSVQPALLEAAMTPSVPRKFYEKYDKAKIPAPEVGKNVLAEWGVPYDRTSSAFSAIVANAKFCGIITSVGDDDFLQINSITQIPSSAPHNAKSPPTQQTPVQSSHTNAPQQDNSSHIESLQKSSLPVGDGELILLMPSEFKDLLLNSDDEDLETAWKNARKALKTLAEHVPKENIDSQTHSKTV